MSATEIVRRSELQSFRSIKRIHHHPIVIIIIIIFPLLPRFHFHTPLQCMIRVSETAWIQWHTGMAVQGGEFLSIGPLSDFPRGNDLCGALKPVPPHPADNFAAVGLRRAIAQSELVAPFGGC